MTSKAKSNCPLWWCVLPLTLLAMASLLVLGFVSLQQITSREHQHVTQQANLMAAALADQLAEVLHSKQEGLRILAHNSRTIAALQGDSATRDLVAKQIGKPLSGLVRLRLFSAYFNDIEPDIQGVAPIGFAGVDMVKRAMWGEPTPAEVHQIDSGSPYIATAVPVKIGVETRGVLFAAWSLDLIKNVLRPTRYFPGQLHIVQEKPAQYVLAGDAAVAIDDPAGQIPVNGAVWHIIYQPSPSENNVWGLVILLLALLGALLLAAGLQLGLLRRDMHTQLQPAKPSSSSTAARRQIHSHIFRAYDIRGLVGSELNAEIAYLLGQAFAAHIKAAQISKVYLAHDARLSSPELAQSFEQGLLEQGIDVLQLGMAPVALLYYAMHEDKQSAAVMVSGSHNPPEYNGFKLYLQAAPMMDLAPLLRRMRQADFPAVARGRATRIDVREKYLDKIQMPLMRKLKVVVDAGNGVGGEIACDLLTRQGAEVVPLYCEPDGHFPNHHPDPSQPDNLADLAARVMASEADLGIAFDGDGDRLSLIDDQGQWVRSEHVFMLLAGDILQRHAQAKMIYDVKSSAHLADYIAGRGGEPVLCASGYTRIWRKIQDTDALFGGEFSGHYFIRENWHGTDDAIYVAARLVRIISQTADALSEQLALLPKSPASPEYQMLLQEGEAPLILQALEKQLAFDANVTRIDGLRVECDGAWGLIRSSNTLPSLTFRFEADDEAKLHKIKHDFRIWLQGVVPDKPIPF